MKRIEVSHVENVQKIEIRKMTRAEAGRLGGLKKVKKGFAMDREKASAAGRIGGMTTQKRRSTKHA